LNKGWIDKTYVAIDTSSHFEAHSVQLKRPVLQAPILSFSSAQTAASCIDFLTFLVKIFSTSSARAAYKKKTYVPYSVVLVSELRG